MNGRKFTGHTIPIRTDARSLALTRSLAGPLNQAAPVAGVLNEVAAAAGVLHKAGTPISGVFQAVAESGMVPQAAAAAGLLNLAVSVAHEAGWFKRVVVPKVRAGSRLAVDMLRTCEFESMLEFLKKRPLADVVQVMEIFQKGQYLFNQMKGEKVESASNTNNEDFIKELNDFTDKLRQLQEEKKKEIESTDDFMVTSPVVSRRTGIPVARLDKSEKARLIVLDERLRKRVIGQDAAVSAVADAILTSKAGLVRRQKPTGSFLFVGPTGVGKTELAKALAEQLFDDEKLLISIDMSEYMDQHSVAQLIGAPPGISGHEKGGQLTEAVRLRPYILIMFDKVEKAHAVVLKTLQQVLDDGSLTDGQGRTVDFTNTVIIMTSNIGAENLLAGISGNTSMQSARERVLQEVRSRFGPELIDRLDETVVFDPLTEDQLKKVARLQMKDAEAGLAERGIALVVTDAALELELALNKANDPNYGARPIKRWVEKKVVPELSRMLLKDEIDDNSTIIIDANPNGLHYKVEKNVRVGECSY